MWTASKFVSLSSRKRLRRYPNRKYIGHVVCLIHVICMPCASLVLEPPQKLVQVTTLQHVGNCLVHVIVALLRILQTRKRLKQKNMIHPNIHPLQCLTSLQGCFLRCPLKSPLWPMRRAGQSIRKLAECFRASVSWLLIFSKGCTGRFFSERMGQNATFWKKSNFWREQMQGFFDRYFGVYLLFLS